MRIDAIHESIRLIDASCSRDIEHLIRSFNRLGAAHLDATISPAVDANEDVLDPGFGLEHGRTIDGSMLHIFEDRDRVSPVGDIVLPVPILVSRLVQSAERLDPSQKNIIVVVTPKVDVAIFFQGREGPVTRFVNLGVRWSAGSASFTLHVASSLGAYLEQDFIRRSVYEQVAISRVIEHPSDARSQAGCHSIFDL